MQVLRQQLGAAGADGGVRSAVYVLQQATPASQQLQSVVSVLDLLLHSGKSPALAWYMPRMTMSQQGPQSGLELSEA